MIAKSRKKIATNIANLSPTFKNKNILIAGAAGSIGSELCWQVAKLNPKSLILVDFNETELFYLELRLKDKFPALNLLVRIADIKDQLAMEEIIRKSKPDVIFQAAAYKHISMMELHPREAVLNNILGTKILALAAKKFAVKKFIFISTDKAADPSSIMGTSKKLSEVLINGLSGGKTRFITVRFGNVLGSRGSVVPIFEEQIRNGGPVTITDSQMTRYFITAQEAVYLVLEAAKIGRGKDIYLLDMGKPIKIIELADKMIRAFGLVPKKDIAITFVGKRAGEKIEEQLKSTEEHLVKTSTEKLLKIKNDKELNKKILSEIDKLIDFAQKNTNGEKIRKLLFGTAQRSWTK